MIIKYEGEDPNHLQHLYPTPSLEGILNVPYQKARLDWCRDNTEGDRILDVGCCSGYVLAYVPGKEKIGLDNSEVRLKLASYEFGNKDYIWMLGSATELPFKNKEFDTVLITETLEHLTFEDAQTALAEAVRVGKKVLITLPLGSVAVNHEHLWECSVDNVIKLLSPYGDEKCIWTNSECCNFWLIIIK